MTTLTARILHQCRPETVEFARKRDHSRVNVPRPFSAGQSSCKSAENWRVHGSRKAITSSLVTSGGGVFDGTPMVRAARPAPPETSTMYCRPSRPRYVTGLLLAEPFRRFSHTILPLLLSNA